MGVSTDAILFYGFPYGDEGDHDYEWEDTYITKVSDLPADYDHDPFHPGGNSYDYDYKKFEQECLDTGCKALCDEYYKQRRAILKECPVEIGAHCSGEYPMNYVAIKKSHVTASRGYPERIGVGLLNVDHDWHQQLYDFCKLMDIEFQEPGWYIASWWG